MILFNSKGLRSAAGLAAGLLLLTWAGSGRDSQAAQDEQETDQATTVLPGSVTGIFLSRERLKTRGDTSQRNVVIYLTQEKEGEYAPPQEPVIVGQKKLKFIPHVVPILRGTTVRFENLDDVTHNTFASDTCCSMDVDMDAGKNASYVFNKSGVASLVCRLHPDMSMWVVVLDNPYFTGVEVKKEKVDDENVYRAKFTIEGVPPGTYTLTFWNKKLAPQETSISVASGIATEVDILIEK